MNQFRKILFPFSIVYYLVTLIRNFCFDVGVLKSKSYNFPIVVVGNLNVGGTGKSPMVEYLIKMLKTKYTTSTLSRGYKRKSKGFVLSDMNSTADDIGDEPLQFKTKFPDINVAVDADRQNGIELLQQLTPRSQVVILDDAFQHRKVHAGFYILLTKYDDLFCNDFLLPTGNLREPRSGYKRADVILVTKCPDDLSDENKNKIINAIKPVNSQEVFFTSISYSKVFVIETESKSVGDFYNSDVTVVTGIANPKPFILHLESTGLSFTHKSFKDHHNFSKEELKELSKKNVILTTEKDYMRLKDQLSNVFYMPIEVNFIEHEQKFQDLINSYIKKGLNPKPL